MLLSMFLVLQKRLLSPCFTISEELFYYLLKNTLYSYLDKLLFPIHDGKSENNKETEFFVHKFIDVTPEQSEQFALQTFAYLMEHNVLQKAQKTRRASKMLFNLMY